MTHHLITGNKDSFIDDWWFITVVAKNLSINLSIKKKSIYQCLEIKESTTDHRAKTDIVIIVNVMEEFELYSALALAFARETYGFIALNTFLSALLSSLVEFLILSRYRLLGSTQSSILVVHDSHQYSRRR